MCSKVVISYSVRVIRCAVICGLIGIMTGCGTRTVKGGTSDSPDGKNSASLRLFGAYGKAFSDYSEKEVLVTIRDGKKDGVQQDLFKKMYKVKGTVVGADVIWENQEGLRCVIYDQRYNASDVLVGKKIITTLYYKHNKFNNTFYEQ